MSNFSDAIDLVLNIQKIRERMALEDIFYNSTFQFWSLVALLFGYLIYSAKLEWSFRRKKQEINHVRADHGRLLRLHDLAGASDCDTLPSEAKRVA
jgi:hypothetical protein